MQVILHRTGHYSSTMQLHAATGANTEILNPLAQAISQLEQNRKNFNLRVAIAERAIMTTIQFETLTGRYAPMVRSVTIDMAPGRDTNVVFEAADGARLAIAFTNAVKADWMALVASEAG